MEIFADLHVHIGRSENNKPIKITAAKSLNFANIAKECYERKGIDVVSVIDCASPYVIQDIEDFLSTGEAYELEEGGIIYKNKVCIILGAEIETSEKNEDGKTGSAHNLCYFPKLEDIKAFSKEMSTHIKNITLNDTEYNGGICIITSYLAKGLEFDGVIISNSGEEEYNSNKIIDMKLLYVAMTRPLHELTILYKNDITKPLLLN